LEKLSEQNDGLITLFHGSEKIIRVPEFGAGNMFNDYGRGFYTSPYFELAAEWAVPRRDVDGYVNTYELAAGGLAILDLDIEPFEHWITVLVQNRGGRFSRIVRERMSKFAEMYPFDTGKYDVIKGWRADDAYFSFIRDFFNVGLSLENLKVAMKFGGLGTQYCVVSKKAFGQLGFVEPPVKVSAAEYHPLRVMRDDGARNSYNAMLNLTQGTTIFDMVGRD